MGRGRVGGGEATLDAIREAGVRLIHARGYHAMSMRDLAAEVGIQAPSLYNHMRTKQELLADLITGSLQELMDGIDGALAETTTPVERLAAFVDVHLMFHITRREKAAICTSELRSLEPEYLGHALAMRDAYERRLGDIIRDGVERGDFHIDDVRVATMAVLSMLAGVAQWYRAGGRLGRQAMVEQHLRLVLAALGAPDDRSR